MKSISVDNILKTISLINDLHPELYISCTRGNCFKFYKLLKHLYPEAEAWYNSDHVITLIDGVFYDINGKYDVGEEHNFMVMSSEPVWWNDAEEWSWDEQDKY